MDTQPAATADEALAKIAAENHGVFLTSEALAVGITQQGLTRRLAKGVIRRLHKSVYAMACVPPSQEQVLLAACRWGGAGSAASHRSAAALWNLDGFTLDVLEILTRRRLHSDRVTAHVGTVAPSDLTEISHIPVTKIERTLLDLASVVSTDALEDALDSALRQRLTTVNRIRFRARGGTGKKGVRDLRKLLDERDDRGRPSASRFETRLNRLLVRSGLPALGEFTIWDGGDFIARVDFCFPESRLIVEADGFRWHSGRRAWQRDRERRNQLTTLGWMVIQVTWDDLTRTPDRLIEKIRSMLQPRLPI